MLYYKKFNIGQKESLISGWGKIVLIIIPYLFIVGGFQLIGGQIAGVDMSTIESRNDSSIQDLIIAIFNMVGTFLVLWLFMKFVDKEPFVKLGFETKDRLKDVIYGIVIGFVIMAIGFASLIYLEEVFFLKLIFDLKELGIAILLFFIVAVVEEALFRGYVLKNLMQSFNKYVALIVSAIIFSLAHGFNPNIDLFSLLSLFGAGILLGLSYIYTKNLWFPIALHLSWNLFQSLFGFNVSGLDTYSLVEFTIPENNILNGGAFGFEGSYLAIIAQLLTISSIGFYYRYRKVKPKDHV